MSSHQDGSKETLKKENLADTTVEMLVGKYADGKEKKIGIEIELPFVSKDDYKPLPFSGKKSITAIFSALCKKSIWQPADVENGKVTSLKSEIGSVTLEPGGQIEFSSSARDTLGELKADIGKYVSDCKVISQKLGVDVVPFGFHPHVTLEECPYISERSRFSALKPVFEAERGYAAWGQSCSVQVTLDSPSVEGSFDAFRLGLILQPVAAAIFANSPFAAGGKSGYKSWRRLNLQSLDNPLYNVPEGIFEPNFTLRDWALHVLNVPMSFIVRGDSYIAVAPLPFSDMVGKPLPELSHLPEEDRYLTKNDLLDHLTGIKPEMLLKPNLLLEFRAADLGPDPEHWMAVGAFWTGLFYDKEAYEAAQKYVSSWTAQERGDFGMNVAKSGLEAKIAGKNTKDIALDLLQISRQGLLRVEPSAATFLDPVIEEVRAGITSADIALDKFNKAGGNIKPVIEQTFLFSPCTRNRTEKARHF